MCASEVHGARNERRRREEKRRGEKEKKRKEMQRSGWLFIGCARFRSLASKGLPPRLRSLSERGVEKRQKGSGMQDPRAIFIIPRHYSFDARARRGGNRCNPVHFLRLAPLFADPVLWIARVIARSYHLIFLLRGERNVESSKPKEDVKEQTEQTERKCAST